MLSPSDANLAARDPLIPGLRVLLDPEELTRLLHENYPDRQFTTVAVRYLRYKPATKCLAALVLESDGIAIDAYAVAFAASERHRVQKALDRKITSRQFDPGRFFDEPSGIIVSIFPNDMRLHALQGLEPDGLRGFLEAVAPDNEELGRARLVRLTWKPERRFVGRLDVDGQPMAVIRHYEAAEWDAALTSTLALRSSQARVPRTLAFSERHRTLLQEWIPGIPLTVPVHAAEVNRKTFERAGAALASFHAAGPLPSLKIRNREREIAGVRELGRWIATVDPDAGLIANQCARELANALGALELREASLIHGDFHPSQLLAQELEVRILDMDDAALGDPLEDLANFAAHLDRDVALGRTTAGIAETILGAVLDGYGKGVAKESWRFEVYRAAALFRLVPEPFRLRSSGWSKQIQCLLDRVQAAINGARLSSGRIPKRPLTPLDELIEQSITPDRARSFLSNAFRVEPSQLQLHEARLVRRKPGRRAMVEYTVTINDGRGPSELTVLGKIRVKGMDRAAFETCVALRSAGFDERSAVAVPEPVWLVPELSMWLQRKVDGIPASKLLLGPGAEAVAIRIAEAAWALHRSALSSVRSHSVDDEVAVLEDRLEALASESAAWHRRVEHLLELSRVSCSNLNARPIATIHRDFYPEHVLVEGERLWIIDLDQWCFGDPALDIGNFVAHLEELALRKTGNPLRASPAVEALVGRYIELAGDSHRVAIDVYTALSLARLVGISRDFEDRRELTSRLADHTEARFAAIACIYSSQLELHPDTAEKENYSA